MFKFNPSSFRPKIYTRNYSNVYLAAGKRTAFAKFGGPLKDIPPNDLATITTKAALESANISPTLVDHVVFSNVLPSTTDTLYGARHLALKIGAKISTPGYGVNRLCGSGIQAIVDAKFMIERGEAECVVVSGVENMSMTPHLTYGTRFGSRLESFKVVDFLMDTLYDYGCQTSMAITAENLAEKYRITRNEVDQFSLESHQRAADAASFLKEDIVPIPWKKGILSLDEHVRPDTSLPDLAKLKPVFKKDGVVTAGNSSGIVDGAASVILCSERFLNEHNINPLATIGDWSVVGVEPKEMGIGPVPAINKLLYNSGLKLSEIDLFEINEAFAAQSLSVLRELSIDRSKHNIWGGGISIGHPLGASGIRITLTLAQQLIKNNKNTGIASACIGGGQGIAVVVNRAY